ncbi:hypothetical protein L208DRAFT_1289999, partial [Tricholoma matsutake]
ILGISKGILRVFSSDFPLLGVSPIPVICSIILTSDFPLLEAEVALIESPETPPPLGLLGLSSSSHAVPPSSASHSSTSTMRPIDDAQPRNPNKTHKKASDGITRVRGRMRGPLDVTCLQLCFLVLESPPVTSQCTPGGTQTPSWNL